MNTYLIPLLTLKENGGGLVALSLAKSISDDGHKVVIISSDYHGKNATFYDENKGIKFIVTPKIFNSKYLSMLLFFSVCFFYSLFFKPFLIYTHFATNLIPSFNRKRPVMLTQDIEYRFFLGTSKRIAKIFFYYAIKSNYLIITNHYLSVYFRRLGCKILSVDEIGISKVSLNYVETKNNKRNFDFFLIAKAGAHKRYLETIKLTNYLSSEGFKVILIDQNNSLDVNSQVKKFKAVPYKKVLSFYRNSKVFISLSKNEGYGLTPLEAYANGSLVLSTSTPSLRGLKSDRVKIISSQIDLLEEFKIEAKKILANFKIGEKYKYDGFILESWSSKMSKIISLHFNV